MTVAVIMFKRLGISNTDIALYTSWLYLPWVIKPFWSPLVDLLKTKRWWIVVMQLLIGACLGGIAMAIPLPIYFKATLIILWLLAFSSATHDIAADGFYLHGLTEHQQTLFVGIRSTFYRIAMITGQGLLIILAGFFETYTGLPPIELNVKADQNIPKEITLPKVPENAKLDSSKTYFWTYPDQPNLSTQLIAKADFDSVKKLVTDYNIQNGFVKDEKQIPEDELSWWTKYISRPFGVFLKQKFNSEVVVANDSQTGNISVVAIKLSQKPEAGKEMVLNFKFQRGDNSINLLKGDRLAFTEKNWDKPAYLLFQVDSKLKRSSEALFKGTSGNIHLAWSITFFVLAVMFVLFSFFHKYALPYPASDQPARSSKNLANDFILTIGSFFMKKK
ncbi:MAG: AmpG family muropeptide MFS transporter [Bacteroidales bacterium]|nr:AmpG family muropeptide MFS transporter [Bacteroidales bacterium]